MHISIGKLDVEAGSCRHRIGPIWVPHDLHLWWGHTGLHAYLLPRPAAERDTAP
jgi:hypothetical protein